MTPVIHSDGSITPEDVLRFRQFFGHVRFIWPEDADRWVEQRFAGSEFDALRGFRSHFFWSKVLAFHMSEQARVVVRFVSDILIFDRPTEVIERCAMAHESLALTSFHDEFDWGVGIGSGERARGAVWNSHRRWVKLWFDRYAQVWGRAVSVPRADAAGLHARMARPLLRRAGPHGADGGRVRLASTAAFVPDGTTDEFSRRDRDSLRLEPGSPSPVLL